MSDISDDLEITLVKECDALRAEVERLRRDLEIWRRNGGDILLRAEIERLKAERDEWKAKWMSLAAASLIAGTMTLEQKDTE